MKTVIEYVTQLLPDGHLSIPEEVRQALTVTPEMQVQVTIKLLQPEETLERNAWELFRRLGQNAAPGHLPDASTKHDQHLYKKEN